MRTLRLLLVALMVLAGIGLLYAGSKKVPVDQVETEQAVEADAGATGQTVEQDAEAAGQTGEQDIIGEQELVAQKRLTPGRVFKDSGNIGVIILLIFCWAAGMAILRARKYYRELKIKPAFQFTAIKRILSQSKPVTPETLNLAIKHQEVVKDISTLGFIYWNGLKGYKDALEAGKTGDPLKEAVMSEFLVARLQKYHTIDAGLFWYDILAQLCTYFGLLGTIWGLLIAFDAMSKLTNDVDKQARLSDGIATAVGTTAVGLVAAIALTFVSGFFKKFADRLKNDAEEYTTKLEEFILNEIS